VELAEGTRVGVRVDEGVGVRLGVQVAQWVSDGLGVRLGGRGMVEVCTGVAVARAGVSVRMGALVQMEVSVGGSEGACVAVHVGEGVGEAGATGLATAPVIIKEMQAMDNKTRTMDSPK
jgi:hypothetical protein